MNFFPSSTEVAGLETDSISFPFRRDRHSQTLTTGVPVAVPIGGATTATKAEAGSREFISLLMTRRSNSNLTHSLFSFSRRAFQRVRPSLPRDLLSFSLLTS